jgi:hypothetical protein
MPHHSVFCHRSLLCALAIALLWPLVSGCGSTDTAEDETAHYIGAYVDPSATGGAVVLEIQGGSRFTLRLEAAQDDEVLAEGSWALGEGSIDLDGGTWSASLKPDEIPVSITGRRDTLHGLRRVSVTETGPLSSARFVRRQEFRDFLYPPEGFGSEGM